MTGKLVLLGLLLVCVAAGAESSGVARQPSCIHAAPMCPRNYEPVCGSNGQTYANECELCAARQESKMDILIAKDGKC